MGAHLRGNAESNISRTDFRIGHAPIPTSHGDLLGMRAAPALVSLPNGKGTRPPLTARTSNLPSDSSEKDPQFHGDTRR